MPPSPGRANSDSAGDIVDLGLGGVLQRLRHAAPAGRMPRPSATAGAKLLGHIAQRSRPCARGSPATVDLGQLEAEARRRCAPSRPRVWLSKNRRRLGVVVGELLGLAAHLVLPCDRLAGTETKPCACRPGTGSRRPASSARRRRGRAWIAWRCMPSRWLLCTGATGALIGISWKFGPPRRVSWVSTYEKRRPCSSGSLVKSMPGHDVRRAEGHLLGLGEEVVRVAVEHHAADRAAPAPAPRG